MVFFGGGIVCFSDPTCPPGVPVRHTYSLSSLTFKRVTRGSAIKTQFPSPLLLQVPEGAIGCLERTNNLLLNVCADIFCLV